MTNRVRYYITESDDRAVVRSVPVTVVTQPTHDLMSIEKSTDAAEKTQSQAHKSVGRIVKVLRKPTPDAPGR